ncbi:MAG: hypothetical protein WD424_03815, partial [Paenibacillaceae bacterium]
MKSAVPNWGSCFRVRPSENCSASGVGIDIPQQMHQTGRQATCTFIVLVSARKTGRQATCTFIVLVSARKTGRQATCTFIVL